jgi:putative ABC transport system permease protein
MDGLPPTIAIVPQGFQFPAGKDSATEASSIVDEHYFDAIRVPIVKGRAFRTNDTPQAPRVAIVNEAFVDRYWPNQDVIGKRFRLNGSAGALVEIVGVAKTTKYSFVIERPKPFVYLPYRQQRSDSLFLLVRFDGDPALLVSRLREAVYQLDPSLPVANVRTMDELYRMRSVEVLHVLIACIGAMGVMALALSIVGLYGLVAYAASRRTKEIGIRVAVGADRSDIVRMMMRHGLVIAIAGLTFGLAAGVLAARALWIVFPGGPAGDGRTDPLAFVSVAAVVLAVTLVAAYLPAHRASAINPIDALRRD